MTTTLLDLGNLWQRYDLILKYLPTKDLASFANISKKSLKFVQDFFKTIKKSYENSHYGFILGHEGIQFKLPHEKCLLKIWEDKGQIYDHVTHRNSNEFFKSGYSYQFANNATIQITKIKQKSQDVIKVHGWVLSGSGTFKMIDKDGKRYFRPYPIWSYITVDTYKRFKILPGLVRAI
jgi:hypothetical protein